MNKKILLIITGSVAAYKAMDLIRLLAKKSFDVTCVLTKAACEFITPLLASSLSGNKTYNQLFSIDDELEMGHINLSRQVDLIVVAPATADFIAKIANGFADDLASSVVLAANKKIIIAPAMNEKMWSNKSTQKNIVKAVEAGISMIEPESDILACGEFGIGKMAAPEKICQKICDFASAANEKIITKKIADSSLRRLEIDSIGLDSSDYRYLLFIAKNYRGGPVGIDTIASAISEEKDSVEDTIEPYLIQKGFVEKTPRGRVLTDIALKHLGIEL